VDAFISDPLCFAALKPESAQSFFAASAIVGDPTRLRKIRPELPIYLVPGAEDPVGQQLEDARILRDRYRSAALLRSLGDAPSTKDE
jgi:hypothetical protein